MPPGILRFRKGNRKRCRQSRYIKSNDGSGRQVSKYQVSTLQSLKFLISWNKVNRDLELEVQINV